MEKVIFFSILFGFIGAMVGQLYMGQLRREFMRGKCYATVDNETYEVIAVVIDFDDCFIKDKEKLRLLNDEEKALVFK